MGQSQPPVAMRGQVTDPVEPAMVLDTVAVSQALQGALSRQFLERPLGEVVRPLPAVTAPRTGEPVFLRVERIGKPLSATAPDSSTALQNVLTACHIPGEYTLIFLLASDGHRNGIYLGAQSRGHRDDAWSYLHGIDKFLEANWPGTQLVACGAEDEGFLRQVRQPLTGGYEGADGHPDLCAVAITGVPSLKAGERNSQPQTLDRLLNGMRGRPFLYMVIAEPMSGEEVGDIIRRCRDLISDVHTFAKSTLTNSANEQHQVSDSDTTGTTRQRTKQRGTTSGTSESESSWRQVLSELKALGTGRLKGGSTQSTTEGEAETEGESSSRAHSVSLARSAGYSLGQEYIDSHAQAVEGILQQYVKRFELSRAQGCWNVGVYFFAGRDDLAQQGAMQIKALLTGEKSLYEPVRTHPLHPFWSQRDKVALQGFNQPVLGLVRPDVPRGRELTHVDRMEHVLGPAFGGLTTPLNTEELAILTNLPQREIAGIPLVATTSFSLNVAPQQAGSVVLGHLLEGSRPIAAVYSVAPNTLTKHALITGTTGSGKSTTCRRLIRELYAKGIPFLVIEPAKDEYVAWAMAVNEQKAPSAGDRIKVYMPGASTWRGQPLEDKLRLNPLDIVWLSPDHQPLVLSHVDRLKSILNSSFPMQEALPILLEEVLFAVYSRPFNWIGEELPPFDTQRPTLSQMYDVVRDVIRQKGYEERVTANLTAALMTRIQSLRRGWKGQLFDVPRSTPWAELFERPAVINLSNLGDEADRAFAMAVLLQFLYEYREAQRANSERDATGSLRHVTVVEEAHRVLQRAAPGLPTQANPEAKVAEMFSNILSEIRAYGEGLLIVDQVPGRLVPDAIKNTNLKIVHRLIASDDRDAMSGCMTLTPDQAALINRLRTGQAIVFGDQDDMAAWVHISSDGGA